MTTRQFIITLRIDIGSVSNADLQQGAKDGMCEVDELPQVEDVDEHEVAESVVAMILNEDVQQEWLWAGSGIYARVESAYVADAAEIGGSPA